MLYLFYFKEIEKVSNKKAVCLGLESSLFSLPYDSDCRLLLHKIIRAEILLFLLFSSNWEFCRMVWISFHMFLQERSNRENVD